MKLTFSQSDVGFDGSYEALLALSEQLGVVPRGISDSSFSALRTTLFKDLEPELVAMSPALSTISSINAGELSDASPKSPFSSPTSPTRGSFPSTRMTRKESGKWVAQCSICLDEYAKEDVCVTLECTHFFHQLCVRVSTWSCVRLTLLILILGDNRNGSALLPLAHYADIHCPEVNKLLLPTYSHHTRFAMNMIDFLGFLMYLLIKSWEIKRLLQVHYTK